MNHLRTSNTLTYRLTDIANSWLISVFILLTIAAFGILYIFTAVMILIGFPFIFFKMKKTVGILMGFWAKSVFFIIGKKLHVEGLQNLKKGDKYILIANHSSLFDIIAITAFYPGITWLGHERLMKIPVFRQVLRMTDYVPMKKTNASHTRQMITRLTESSKSHTIAIFPEGTRTLNGKMNEFYRGFIYLLRAAEINILPVTLNGFYRLKPKNRFYIDFNSRISLIIHKPVEKDSVINMNDSEIISHVKNIIESSLS
jgi:1-acyl-sn-glycerol-3-phosphate acyltransferase